MMQLVNFFVAVAAKQEGAGCMPPDSGKNECRLAVKDVLLKDLDAGNGYFSI